MSTQTSSESDYAAQAKKFGEDLVKLYALEKTKRVKLEISNQKLKAIFSTTPYGLAIVDQEFNIEEANPAFWTLIETPDPERTVPLAQMLPFPELITQLEDILPEEQTLNKIEFDIPLANAIIRTLLFTVAPLSAGNERGWMLIIRDLTERKRLVALKSEFINIAAHELRTPLASILGFSQVLKDDLAASNNELSLHLVDTIIKSSDRLKSIIDRLIEFADIQHQKEHPQSFDTFDIIAVVKQVMQAMKPIADEKNVTIEKNCNKDQVIITGNQDILKEMLEHLIENGITFNKQDGKVTIHIIEQDDAIIIDVEDTGIGIPQTEISKIFDKFYQVEEHLTRSTGGLGLGLAIVQRGASLHSGFINVTSALNQGSCFTIILPKPPPATTLVFEDGLKNAYQQSIAYGKDLARALTAERAMTLKLKKTEETRQELIAALENNAPLETLRAIIDRMSIEN